MDKINCEIKLRLESNEKSPKDIIEYVKKLNKFEIDYGKELEYALSDNNEKNVRYVINTKNSIDKSITSKDGGIYFIISYEEDKLLYIGKSRKLNSRLSQHLIKCSLSTGSHILDMIDYLKKRKESKQKLAIKYCVIYTFENKNNAAIEGALTDYVSENKDEPYFSECWNKRHD